MSWTVFPYVRRMVGERLEFYVYGSMATIILTDIAFWTLLVLKKCLQMKNVEYRFIDNLLLPIYLFRLLLPFGSTGLIIFFKKILSVLDLFFFLSFYFSLGNLMYIALVLGFPYWIFKISFPRFIKSVLQFVHLLSTI